jgi:hypothetical protein
MDCGQKRSKKEEAQQALRVAQGQENLCGQTGPEGLRHVPLLCRWQGANAMGQDCNQNAHKEPLDWRQIQQGDSREILDFIDGLHLAPQACCLPC